MGLILLFSSNFFSVWDLPYKEQLEGKMYLILFFLQILAILVRYLNSLSWNFFSFFLKIGLFEYPARAIIVSKFFK